MTDAKPIPEPPELRGQDKHKADGNVRPADDRFLTAKQIEKRDAYVEKVDAVKAENAVREAAAQAPDDDPIAGVLQDAVDNAVTQPEPNQEDQG